MKATDIEKVENDEGIAWYEGDWEGDPVAKCETRESLDAWAKEGGWDGVDNFLEEFSIELDEVLGKWFLTIGMRIYIYD